MSPLGTVEAAAAGILGHFASGRVVRAELDPSWENERADAHLEIEVAGISYGFEVELVRQMNVAKAFRLGMIRRGHPGHLIVTERIQPAVARTLTELGVSYADLAGNCHIERPPLLIHVEGLKGERMQSEAVRAFSGEGLRVIFVLLLQPDFAGRSYRELAALSGASLGVVQYTVTDLERLGYVVPSVRTGRRIQDVPGLLDRWAARYAESFRPKKSLGTFRFFAADAFGRWDTIPLDGGQDRWGGEPAAARRTGYLKPGRLTLYTRGDRSGVLLRLRLLPDEGGRVEVIQAFWPEALERTVPDQFRDETVPDVLTYADLLASDDPRNAEVAALIRDRIIEAHDRG